MVRKTKIPYAPLLATVTVLAIAVLCSDVERFALTAASPLCHRLTYMWFHAGIVHALFNVWCLLALTAVYNPRNFALVASVAIATTCPAPLLPAAPVIGLSGACFALMGLSAAKSRGFLRFNLYALAFIAVGFLFPFVAAWLHLYCYAVGLLLGGVFYFFEKCRKK